MTTATAPRIIDRAPWKDESDDITAYYYATIRIEPQGNGLAEYTLEEIELQYFWITCPGDPGPNGEPRNNDCLFTRSQLKPEQILKLERRGRAKLEDMSELVSLVDDRES